MRAGTLGPEKCALEERSDHLMVHLAPHDDKLSSHITFTLKGHTLKWSHGLGLKPTPQPKLSFKPKPLNPTTSSISNPRGLAEPRSVRIISMWPSLLISPAPGVLQARRGVRGF